MSYFLRKLRDAVSLEILLQVYYAHIHSNIKYGVLFWGNSTDVDRILIVQKRCVRLIANAKRDDHARPIFRNLRILTVIDTYILECALFVKNNMNLFENHHFQHLHDTRNREHLVVMQTSRTYIDSGVLNTSIRVYNKVPKEIKRLSPSAFKKELKSFLLQKNYYALEEFIEQ